MKISLKFLIKHKNYCLKEKTLVMIKDSIVIQKKLSKMQKSKNQNFQYLNKKSNNEILKKISSKCQNLKLKLNI